MAVFLYPNYCYAYSSRLNRGIGMESALIFGAIFLIGGMFQIFINYVLAPWLGCGILHPLPVFLRGLVLLTGLIIYDPSTRSHMYLNFSAAIIFDYLYFRLLGYR